MDTSRSPSFLKRNVSVHPMSQQNQVVAHVPPHAIEIFPLKSMDSTSCVVKRNNGDDSEHKNSQSRGVDKGQPCWAIIKGFIRENSLGGRVARFISSEVELNWDYHTVQVDCMPLGLEEWDEEYEEVWADIRNTNPTAYSITLPSPQTREKRLIEAMNLIDGAQGLILVTGEYNLSLPNTVRTLFESLPRSVYLGKPCAVVCYSPGISAGKRAGAQARAFLGDISCLTIGSILALPQVHLNITSEGKCDKEDTVQQLKSLLHNLSWYTSALSSYRNQHPPNLSLCNSLP